MYCVMARVNGVEAGLYEGGHSLPESDAIDYAMFGEEACSITRANNISLP